MLIGGDFNTITFEPRLGARLGRAAGAAATGAPARAGALRADVRRARAARGYDWSSCNTPGVPTQRTRPDGTPPPPFGRIDWFFSRGLAASDPATVPAVDDAGIAISDHEVLAVEHPPRH